MKSPDATLAELFHHKRDSMGMGPSLNRLAMSTGGRLGLALRGHWVAMGDGEELQQVGHPGRLAGDSKRPLAPDDRGRLWVTSGPEVTIYGPGEAETKWAAGTVPELPYVHEILFVDGGPDLPRAP